MEAEPPRGSIRDPGKESRAASGIPVIPALDGFRALAILGIVLYHVLLFSGGGLRIADTVTGDAAIMLPLGVDLLFIISGFVVFLPTVVREGEFGNVSAYAIRRAARLVPAAWLAIAIVLVLLAVAPPSRLVFAEGAGSFPLPGPLAFIGHLLFLQTPVQLLDLDFPRGLGIAGPLWTLSLELIFYAILPLIAAAWFRRPWLGLAISAAISVSWHLAFAHLAGVVDLLGLGLSPSSITATALASDYQFPAFAFSFGAGMTAAYAYVQLRQGRPDEELQRRAARVQPAALVAVALFIYLSTRYGLQAGEIGGAPSIGRNAPLVAIGFNASLVALILATALAPRRRQLLVSSAPARWLADVSYGIYLIHYAVLAYLLVVFSPSQNGSPATVALWSGAALAISMLYGYLSARLLEQPIRRWAHRFGRRADRSQPAASQARRA